MNILIKKNKKQSQGEKQKKQKRDKKKIHEVVEINKWKINAALNTVIKHKKDVRHILMVVEDKAGLGHIVSSMNHADTLWFIERYKYKILSD